MHLLKLRVGPWQFAPTLWPTLATLFFFGLTLALGNWQIGRAETKRALQARYDAAVHEAPIHVGRSLLDRDSVLFRKLEVEGVFDDAHTILLDNRVLNGVAGYHVLTPLRISGSRLAILVNRGWVPTGPAREQLPAVPTPAGVVRLEGMAVDPHTRFLELASIASQGRVWQNLDFARYEATTRLELQPVLLLQTSSTADGLQRTWPRPDTGVDTHVGYAFQWYSLAATLAVLWLIMNVKRCPPGNDLEALNKKI
jgi:surfeit locus 1 family protein